jgi:hypothetical protein
MISEHLDEQVGGTGRVYMVALSKIHAQCYNDLDCCLFIEVTTVPDEASARPAARTYEPCIGFNQQSMHVDCYRN